MIPDNHGVPFRPDELYLIAHNEQQAAELRASWPGLRIVINAPVLVPRTMIGNVAPGEIQDSQGS
jgi:hypothetical protein